MVDNRMNGRFVDREFPYQGETMRYKAFSREQERDYGRERDALTAQIKLLWAYLGEANNGKKSVIKGKLTRAIRQYDTLSGEFLANNINMAKFYSIRMNMRNSDIDFEDFFSIAQYKLQVCWSGDWNPKAGGNGAEIKRWDCERGIKFSTYYLRALFREFNGFIRKKRSKTFLSLDSRVVNGEEAKRYNYVEDGRTLDVGSRAILNERMTFLEDSFEVLEEREKEVLRMRFGFNGQGGMTLKEVGKIIKVTRERVRQIEYRALKKLREAIGEKISDDDN